ncbi:23S rRNA (uracil-5-)-methyltransferase RumA [Acetobacter orientalis]|uniref:23S rRNA (Uracil-5-)-methyltransferase RumA n=1 Tax=Acetobacter orientalis TaxID=146474 RepID=A0A2Z5ZDS8_9PROT|nr:23S rRNA (uracil-5-)-methyltransferase RumA [Acetobacter orientalis]
MEHKIRETFHNETVITAPARSGLHTELVVTFVNSDVG